MTVAAATPEPEMTPEMKAVLDSTREVIRDAEIAVTMENFNAMLAPISAMLIAFKDAMTEGGYSKKFVERMAWRLFSTFYKSSTVYVHDMDEVMDDDEDEDDD